MDELKQHLSKFDIKITEKTISDVAKMVLAFELRGSIPLTLNSEMLGVYPIVFTDHDRESLFTIAGITEYQISSFVKETSYFKGNDYKTASDPFAILTVWLLHLAIVQIHDKKTRESFQVNLARYLHYRYFTSLINYSFKHGAKEGVMMYVVNTLSRKFDVIEYGSWKGTIENRSKDLISDGSDPKRKVSIHYKTLVNGGPDKEFVYVIIDVQTRIRDKVKIIRNLYYKANEEGHSIKSSASTSVDREGEKIVVERASTFDSMITTMNSIVVNSNAFVDPVTIRLLCTQFASTSESMLKYYLIQMSELASRQATTSYRNQPLSRIKVGDKVIIPAIRDLIATIISVSFRFCEINQVPLNKPVKVWIALKNVYSSSRIQDADIQMVKDSMEYFIDETAEITRPATKSSLRMALIMYIIYRAQKYLR